MFPPDLLARADALLATLRGRGIRLATAESCTGGLIAALFTEIPGSSDVVECGFVTYSNHAKSTLLAVPVTLLEQHGAVSPQAACAMAEGALAASRATLAVSVTGLAGPGGGSRTKPVGLVYLGLARPGSPTQIVEQRFGPVGRSAVRQQAVAAAVALLEGAVT